MACRPASRPGCARLLVQLPPRGRTWAVAPAATATPAACCRGSSGSARPRRTTPGRSSRHGEPECRASGRVRGKELVLVEWDVQLPPPQMTIISVSGTNVRRWSQSGTRVQVWLERATEVVKLELIGRLTPPPGKESSLVLPNLRVVTAQTQQTTVRLSAAAGLTLTPIGNTLRNLKPVQPERARPDLHRINAVLRRDLECPAGRVRDVREGSDDPRNPRQAAAFQCDRTVPRTARRTAESPSSATRLGRGRGGTVSTGNDAPWSWRRTPLDAGFTPRSEGRVSTDDTR